MSRKEYFAPNGLVITRISSVSWDSPEIDVDDEGKALAGSHDGFPDFDLFQLAKFGPLVMDSDGTEWLLEHCRLVEVYDGFDEWDNPQAVGQWSDAIVADCYRVRGLVNGLWALQKLREFAPLDVVDDPTVKAAIETIIAGRMEGEADELMRKIADYRATRVEPACITDPADEELLELAEQKWQAQIAEGAL